MGIRSGALGVGKMCNGEGRALSMVGGDTAQAFVGSRLEGSRWGAMGAMGMRRVALRTGGLSSGGSAVVLAALCARDVPVTPRVPKHSHVPATFTSPTHSHVPAVLLFVAAFAENLSGPS
eukprot:280216-Rhodomonas_salina.1